jgi:hypothetical protein
MKYTEAWASVVSQNFNLKMATFVLGIVSLVLGMTTLRLTFKDSPIIERGCFSRSLAPMKDEHTKEEIEIFIKEALVQRFDSTVQPVDGLLAPDELKLRLQEQKDLITRNMKQRLVVNSVAKNGDDFLVDADRVISVNEVRSAFKFQLLVKLESKARSYSNPYGLIIVSASQVENKDKK